jgi:DNA-binding transcriptional LysR family regulator
MDCTSHLSASQVGRAILSGIEASMPRPQHLPYDLLQTFALIAELGGDATAVAERLGITQPSISKRLTALRRLTSDPHHQPWLILKGRRWQLTSEGRRVRGVVTDLVRRYEQMERFVASEREGRPVVAIACGQEAAHDFVQDAVIRFLKEHPESRVSMSTPRGKARIEGVAGGQFDLAVVTDSPATIHQVARREMYIETLFADRFLLAANPPSNSEWGTRWSDLPTDRPIAAAELLEIPFVLPEPDSSRRRQFDEWCFRATARTFDVRLETGGWRTILDFAEAGVGVGLVPESAVDEYRMHGAPRLTTRQLGESEFPPDAVRMIARKAHGKDEPELTLLGNKLRQLIFQKIHS